MRKKTIRKIFVWVTFTFIFLVMILGIHIYMVTRPKAPDANTVIMARIDFRQDIDKDDAAKITNWLYQQKGVDHAMCNPENKLAIFTFHPAKMTGDEILRNFKSALKYKADRFVPSAEQMKSGCPVASTSASFKVYSYIKNMF